MPVQSPRPTPPASRSRSRIRAAIASRATKTVTDPNTSAIVITAPNVTLDLDGFTISGPAVCVGAPATCSMTGSGDGRRSRTLSAQDSDRPPLEVPASPRSSAPAARGHPRDGDFADGASARCARHDPFAHSAASRFSS